MDARHHPWMWHHPIHGQVLLARQLDSVHISAGSTNGWTVLEALATVVSAVVVLVGGYLASRYGHRADCHVEGEVFERSDGLGLSVRVEVCARGIRRMRIEQGPNRKPKVEVVEVLESTSPTRSFRDGKKWVSDQIIRESNDTVDPGETLTGSELFFLGSPKPLTVGWTVQFSFQVKRRMASKARRYWYWEEIVFVPKPDSYNKQQEHQQEHQ